MKFFVLQNVLQVICPNANNCLFYLLKFGLCYTFNSDPTKPVTLVAEGLDANLKLTLDTELGEYSDWWTDSAGFRVVVHNPGEKPVPTIKGYYVSPGFVHFLATERHQVGQSYSVGEAGL